MLRWRNGYEATSHAQEKPHLPMCACEIAWWPWNNETKLSQFEVSTISDTAGPENNEFTYHGLNEATKSLPTISCAEKITFLSRLLLMASYQNLELKEVVVEAQTESLVSKVSRRWNTSMYISNGYTYTLLLLLSYSFVKCMFSVKSYVAIQLGSPNFTDWANWCSPAFVTYSSIVISLHIPVSHLSKVSQDYLAFTYIGLV